MPDSIQRSERDQRAVPVSPVPAQRGASDSQEASRPEGRPGGQHRGPDQLPDLVAAMAVVPGGLGVDLPAPLDFAGVRWTVADADGSPIGVSLAIELADQANHVSGAPSADVDRLPDGATADD